MELYGLSPQLIADLTGVSLKTATRWKRAGQLLPMAAQLIAMRDGKGLGAISSTPTIYFDLTSTCQSIQNRECAAMNLIVKIALGIILAGFIGWLLSAMILGTGLIVLNKAIEKTTTQRPVYTQKIQSPPAPMKPAVIPITQQPTTPRPCVNFVQMANGPRHCLENADPATKINMK
jgi:hypothetical protein